MVQVSIWYRGSKYKTLSGACEVLVVRKKGRKMDFQTTSTSQALRRALYLGALEKYGIY